LCCIEEALAHNETTTVKERSGDRRRGDALVHREVTRLEVALDHLDVRGQSSSDSPRCADAEPTRVHKAEVVQREHGVVAQVCVWTDAEHRFHELITTGTRDVVEAVEPVGDVLDAAPMSDLSELDNRHLELFGVACRDIAVLIKGSVTQPSTIGVGEHHEDLLRHNRTVTGTVPIGFSAVRTVP
jgi:hypothetical protein